MKNKCKIKFILIIQFCFVFLSKGNCFIGHDSSDSTLLLKYQTFSPSLIDLFKDTNVVLDLHEFTLRNVSNSMPILDCYWFNTKIEKLNDTLFNFYLNTHFPLNDIDNFQLSVTLKYVLILKTNYYSIELDSSYKALPNFNFKQINTIIQKHKKLKDAVIKGKASGLENDIYLLDYELARGALSGSKECIKLFNNMEKDFPDQIIASALEEHNLSKRILIDYGHIKNPLSTAKKATHFKRRYEYND